MDLARINSRVRELLHDRDPTNYRLREVDFIELVNDAIEEIYRVRPDAFIGRYTFPLPVFTVDDIRNSVSIDLETNVTTAIQFYVVGQAEMRDDEYTTGGRAVAMLNAFYQRLGVASG